MDYNKDAKNGGVNGNRTRSSGAFKTDVDITGLPTSRKKPLQAWTGDDEVIGNGGLEQEVGNGRNWDQFAANERLTGGKTDYHEDIYTTKLDRTGSDYRAREQRAAQLEREILKVGILIEF